MGKWALGQLWDGIKAGAAGIGGWLAGFAKGVIQIFKDIWHWFSPSDVMYQGGKDLMAGLSLGLKDHSKLAIAHAAAAAKAVSGALGGGGGALGGDQSANKALAQQMFPADWRAAGMWPAFDYLEMAEAGYNRFVRNPSSGAYGIPQALPESKMPFAAQAAGGSHAGAQLAWMFDYIRSRWGSPFGAAQNERINHWYAGGTSSAAPGWAWVGERGVPELMHFSGGEQVAPVYAGSGGSRHGGNTYIINVAPAPLARPADIGREVVGVIRAFEKGAGKGWRT
jgi:hypothetical protein